MQTVILSIGTNLGNKVLNLKKALKEINSRAGNIILTGVIYETEPWGFHSEHVFLNQLIHLQTNHSPVSLLSTILDIEKSMGRARGSNGSKYVSRVIDIDILFYGNKVIRKTNLIIPHPLIEERRFILVPLVEIFPDLLHPVNQMTPQQMLDLCPDKSIVKKLPEPVKQIFPR